MRSWDMRSLAQSVDTKKECSVLNLVRTQPSNQLPMRVAAVLVLYKVGGCGVLLVERLVRTSAKFSAAGAAACMLNLARLHDDATDGDALRAYYYNLV
jgi:hypothetical protein